MANEILVMPNFCSGTITDNPLLVGATTFNSAALANVPAIGATQFCKVVLDPLGAGNGPEIAWMTAHTASATSATITRGRENTSAVQHASGTPWLIGPVASDYPVICTAATRPSGGGLPYEGMRIWQTDTDTELVYNGTDWVTTDPVNAAISTSETTTSVSYTDLATPGPAVSLQTGTKALVILSGTLKNSVANAYSYMSYAVSGATTRAAADGYGLIYHPQDNGGAQRFSAALYTSGLTAGVNTFTAKYKVTANTGTFEDRSLTVIGIP